MMETIKADFLKVYKHSVDRLNHVYGVRDMAIRLGKVYGADLDKLEILAYLHDLTKYQPIAFHKSWILKHYDQTILKQYTEPLYHGFSAAALAKEKYFIKDDEMLQALASHTVGRPNMGLLEKILFISDYIEVHRLYPSCVKVREIAFNDLDLAVFTAIDDSIKLYEQLGGAIPLVAYQARDFYKPGGKYV